MEAFALAKSAKKFGSVANACSTHFLLLSNIFYKIAHFLLLFKL
jgi:hypothetical protein